MSDSWQDSIAPLYLPLMSSPNSALRTQFFDYLFGNAEGYLCLCTQPPNDKKLFKQHFFKWPAERENVTKFLEGSIFRKNVWFCTSLLEKAERKKEFCLPSSLVWSDLDTCNPEIVKPAPPCVIESSPNRYQALWRTDQTLEPYVQEDYNKRIAYKYSTNGADPSGWDLTQLLRVPLTFNYKYESEGQEVPEVKLLRALEVRTPVAFFSNIEQAAGSKPIEEIELPNLDTLPSADTVVYKYWHNLSRTAFKTIYMHEPDAESDWSGILWRLINICMEAGMSNEEAFVVALESKCNKYARDNRPIYHLWQDILRADVGQKKLVLITRQFSTLAMPELASEDAVEGSFIEEYKEWATVATDAIEQYHELSAAILLSSVVAGGVRIQTSYGEMVPNLWGLILGDSTLTRKTTAMRMAMDIIADVDSDILLATDGSAEGLLTGLSNRPGKTSIFYKDEVSGFVDSINRKDYLAGMPETLTQLYDVPRLYTRRLRKETITITNPVFIFFGGGIRDKVYSLLSDEYVLSGFLPRFLVVSGEADLSKIRRTGPATSNIDEKRANLVDKMKFLHNVYGGSTTMNIGDQEITIAKTINAELTPDAWESYGEMEMKMVSAANDSQISMLALPTFERMSRSLLKLSVLLAAASSEDVEKLVVTDKNIKQAAYYIQRWGGHTIDLLHNAGKGMVERTIDKILRTIQKHPDITRSKLMQFHHLTSREASEILQTLDDRGMIVMTKEGRGVRLRAV